MNTSDGRETKPRRRPNPATHIAIAILLVVITTTVTAFLAKYGLVPWTTLIFLAGTVGGVVNSFRRIQKLSGTRVWEGNLITTRLITIQIYLSPVVGGVFAIILYGIFMSGFIQSSVFPVFESSKEPFKNFREFAALSMPATHADVAKALVWSFIAGFSEGLGSAQQ